MYLKIQFLKIYLKINTSHSTFWREPLSGGQIDRYSWLATILWKAGSLSWKNHFLTHWGRILNFFCSFHWFSVAEATLESQMSVCMSVRQSVCLSVCHKNKNPTASQNYSYQPSGLLTIKPIDHQAHRWDVQLNFISGAQ